ncbi:MAG: GxxExxY protein [Candidatus Hydrogenedentales bacterium]
MNGHDFELLLKDEVYAIVGAAMEVSNELGAGFLEGVYQEALEIELRDRQIPFAAQVPIGISYKGRRLVKEYIPDLICHDQVIVEIKAIKQLTSIEEAQLLNYLKATGNSVGVLLNFGSPRLEWKRMVLTRPTDCIYSRSLA